ncbi:hypothetical protein SAMD00023353_1001500 [Rosellinia necatrix]|uniref:Something about silencing protein 4 domain-containing protein n=1 Tax=Rosellinia necatrix TaxID=77044 RepID=A0A1W2TBR7_ROSNE|nr:hypothetical protein SAMD00023353_1001500 [Rosellinia necatrix]
MAITVSRRSEGFPRPHQNRKHTRQAQQQQQQQQQQQPQRLLPPSPTAAGAVGAAGATPVGAAAVARMKRPLDPIDNLSDPVQAKRPRIAVEIFARPIAHALGTSKTVLVKRPLATAQPVHVASSRPDRPSPTAANPLPPVPPVPPVPLPTSVPAATTAPPPRSSPLPLPPPPPAPTTTTPTTAVAAASKDNGITRHQEKVINGIRHELGRLHPDTADSAPGPPGGRKLRSQEATRFKSELAAYFPEYDEVIGNDPKEQHLLNADTPIIIIDTGHEPSDGAAAITATATAAACQRPIRSEPRPYYSTVRMYGDCLFTDLQNSPTLNFDFLKTENLHHDLEDPLPDSQFEPAHKRAERLEKSIRNTERGRAQHEKDQIIRLLGELQGHDWLRTMGVNGVTESRRKSFEPARDHFIRGCQAILDKFRLWSQEEKRRKLERERALAEETDSEEDVGREAEDEKEDDEDQDQDQEEEEDDDDEEEEADDGECSEGAGSIDDVDMADVENELGDDLASEGEPPEYSDVDAAARQLHAEAMERAKYATPTSPRLARGEPLPVVLDSTPREFTSFFEKKHQRDAALSKGRRRGRTVLAWGHPIPDMSEYNFELPDFCLDEDTLRTRERQKRRERRHRKQ